MAGKLAEFDQLPKSPYPLLKYPLRECSRIYRMRFVLEQSAMPATVSDEVDLNRVDPKVREFLRSLSIGPQGLNLVLDGQIICKVVPPLRLSEEEKRSLIERRRELMRQARERTKNVPAREMKRKFDAAINEVRRKKA